MFWVRKLRHKFYHNARQIMAHLCQKYFYLNLVQVKESSIVFGIFMLSACAPPLHSTSIQAREGLVDVRPPQDLVCAQQSVMADGLQKNYGERRISYGLTSTGYLLQVFVGKSNFFTIVATDPTGISCIVADGQGWITTQPDAVTHHAILTETYLAQCQ